MTWPRNENNPSGNEVIVPTLPLVGMAEEGRGSRTHEIKKNYSCQDLKGYIIIILDGD